MERKKASFYLRVVDKDQNIVDEQKRVIENASFQNEYELVNSYIDTGDGGNLDRQGLKSLLEDARKHRIDTVFVTNLQQLSTDPNYTTELLEMLSKLNVRVYSVEEKRYVNKPLDTLSNLSREIYNTLSEMQQNGIDLYEDKSTSERDGKKDPTQRLESKIIEAYLDIQNDIRPQV